MAEHACPVWVGYLLASPLRKFAHPPEKIVGPYVREGMTVLDVGCAMGFFSLPLAKLVGPAGRLICVDMQAKMLQVLDRRARNAGLMDRIDLRKCAPGSLGLEDLSARIDFALAFAVVHEVSDRAAFFAEIGAALKPGAKLLIAEPRGHVGESNFERTIAAASGSSLAVIGSPRIRRSRAALLERRVE